MSLSCLLLHNNKHSPLAHCVGRAKRDQGQDYRLLCQLLQTSTTRRNSRKVRTKKRWRHGTGAHEAAKIADTPLFGRPRLSHISYTLAVSSSCITSYVQIGTNWCKDSGIYEFTMGSTGAKVKARYTFVYVYEDGQWKIAHHHSSQMPEAIQPKQPVLNDREVRGLFNVSVQYRTEGSKGAKLKSILVLTFPPPLPL
jgi:SnoaL-like domain